MTSRSGIIQAFYVDNGAHGEGPMSRVSMALVGAIGFSAALMAQGDRPNPSCRMCPGTYIPRDEIQGYVAKAIAENRVDQQVRDVEIGKSHVGIGVVYRAKLGKPVADPVAEHDFVSYDLKPGDVVVIPAGTGHWFTKIDDHITYLMVRIDPDKLTPLRDETASKAYLATRR